MPMDQLGLLGPVLLFFIAWIVSSIPIWIGAKIITPSTATFGRALIASISGFVILSLLFALFNILNLGIIGFIIAFIVLLAIYKSIFSTGWMGALGIIILAFIFSFILALVLGLFIGISIFAFRIF
ncbi:MAG: hypothetical protein RQ952_02130 [Thermoproteota archaeon]|nr:hypothetical protein [Thermoproteota archaeon]